MILDKMLTGRELLEEIVHLKNDPEALKRMARASKSKGRPQAAHDIAELALSIAKGTKYRPRKQKDVTDNDQSK